MRKKDLLPASFIAKTYFAIVITVLISAGYAKHLPKVHANYISPLAVNNVTPTPTPTPKNEDKRITALRHYLYDKASPLTSYADVLVKQADANGIDWTLMTSIAGKESSFGKAIKQDSYNAWGVMAWDEQGNRSIRMFNSWPEAIAFEAALLSKHYRLNANTAIGEKYCPAFECSNTWAKDVTNFSGEILASL